MKRIYLGLLIAFMAYLPNANALSITYPDKALDSPFTPADANEIKQVVNSKEDKLACSAGQTKVWSVSGGWECGYTATAQTDSLWALIGMPAGSLTFGSFLGSTIPDDQVLKDILQTLETAIEDITVGGLAHIDDLPGDLIDNDMIDAILIQTTGFDDIVWGSATNGAQLWTWNTGDGVDPNLQISDAEFSFNKPIRAPSFASSAANGEYFLEADNTVVITLPATLGRLAWYDGKWRLANGTNWTTDFLLTHIGLSTSNISTTGTINGRARVVSASSGINLTTADFGSIILMTGPGEVGLPDCSSSTIGAFVEVRERDAAEQIQLAMYGDTTSDAFVLEDGTVLTANYEADLAMGANNRVCVTCLEENRWYIDEIKGDVTNGGAAD